MILEDVDDAARGIVVQQIERGKGMDDANEQSIRLRPDISAAEGHCGLTHERSREEFVVGAGDSDRRGSGYFRFELLASKGVSCKSRAITHFSRGILDDRINRRLDEDVREAGEVEILVHRDIADRRGRVNTSTDSAFGPRGRVGREQVVAEQLDGFTVAIWKLAPAGAGHKRQVGLEVLDGDSIIIDRREVRKPAGAGEHRGWLVSDINTLLSTLLPPLRPIRPTKERNSSVLLTGLVRPSRAHESNNPFSRFVDGQSGDLSYFIAPDLSRRGRAITHLLTERDGRL